MLGLLTGGVTKYIVGGVFIAIIGVAGTYYIMTQKQIQNLKDEVVQLAIQNQALQDDVAALEKLQKEHEETMKEVQNLNRNLTKREQELNRLRNILFEHDLTNLSLKKPGLIEKRINDATVKVFKELGVITNPTITD